MLFNKSAEDGFENIFWNISQDQEKVYSSMCHMMQKEENGFCANRTVCFQRRWRLRIFYHEYNWIQFFHSKTQDNCPQHFSAVDWNDHNSSEYSTMFINYLSWESWKSRLLKIYRHGHRHWTCPDMSLFFL